MGYQCSEATVNLSTTLICHMLKKKPCDDPLHAFGECKKLQLANHEPYDSFTLTL